VTCHRRRRIKSWRNMGDDEVAQLRQLATNFVPSA
jgi:hypothetical protein